MRKKLILFGAGKIGRSFIGQLFSRGGFEIIFIDINKVLIDELNRKQCYNVIIKSEKEEKFHITNVRGIHFSDYQKISTEISDADIIAVCVGLRGLKDLFPVLAKSLLNRFEAGNKRPADIIIAENMRNAASYFHNGLLRFLPSSYPFDETIGLIETSIGKMVPIMQKKDIEEDMLQVFAEPYNNLILDRKAFKNPIPAIEGLDPKDNMKAWTDRKLFIHNLGHAAVAYYGYNYDNSFIYPWQALQVPAIHDYVRKTMLQAADILISNYPEEFSIETLTIDIDDLLKRFSNKYLGDTLFRVGCDLLRKLGTEDRIAGAIRLARKRNMPFDRILYILVCACHFRAKDEDGKMLREDIEFVRFYERGIKYVLTSICGFNETLDKDLIALCEKIEKNVLRYYN